MNFELYVSLKHLKAKRGRSFLSLLTVISIAGVAVGVMTLIVVLGVMNGFQADIKNKILGVTSHVMVFKIGGPIENYGKVVKRVTHVDGVTAATPFIDSQVMITGFRSASGALLRGIDPEGASKVFKIREIIRKGNIDDLQTHLQGRKDGSPARIPGIILGKEIARNTGAVLHGIVNVISPTGRLTPLGQVPRSKKFRVVGIFESGIYSYDNSLAFINLHEAQHFLGLGNTCTGIEVRVRDVYEANKIAKNIRNMLGYTYYSRDWTQMNKNFFAALKLEKVTMFIILTLIILVAAFNIISTLIMVVMEKTKDIAILKAMGATKQTIMKVFVWQGLIIGALGTLLGLSGGFLLCFLLKKYKFIQLPADVYTISTLPVKVESLDVFLITVATICISFLATIYPSWKASRLNPSEALKYG